ncbi:XdhC family protein, partial [Streptomyces sp. NPDC005134]
QKQLARLRSPIGLDLGARTPEETAISITAEIIAHASRASGLPLVRVSGPIHRVSGAVPETSRHGAGMVSGTC